MYHVTAWLLQPTCHLPGWPNGEVSPEAAFLTLQATLALTQGAHHLNLFWQDTHSRSLAAMEVKGELPSKWRKTVRLCCCHCFNREPKQVIVMSSSRPQGGPQVGLGKGRKTASSERSTSIILTRKSGPFPLNILLALLPACQDLKKTGEIVSLSLCKYLTTDPTVLALIAPSIEQNTRPSERGAVQPSLLPWCPV